MAKVEAGTIFTIPIESGHGLAKTIYASDYFKDLILIKIYKFIFNDEISATDIDESMPFDLYYTGNGPIQSKKWKIVGLSNITEEERALSRRLVGGGVWIEDSHVGPPSAEDQKTLPQMDTYGRILIEKAVARFPMFRNLRED